MDVLDVEKSWYERKPDGNGKPLSRPNLTVLT